MSQFSKSRASGSHYTSDGGFPAVAGSDGVGVTQDGRRVYFALPRAPFGALAELCPVSISQCVELPESLDEITAAAIANPGMSAWAALVERAHLVGGETVLVNGATGTAGKADSQFQLAKHLNRQNHRDRPQRGRAGRCGSSAQTSPFRSTGHVSPSGAKDYENALKSVFASGIDVVIDYLWGESAKTIVVAIAKTVEDGTPVRFVHVGGASREENIDLPGAALRSSAIMLMGSGAKSVRLPVLLQAVRNVFEAVGPACLKVATTIVPLSEVEEVWDKAAGKPRVVFSISSTPATEKCSDGVCWRIGALPGGG